jgi:hypothetical protein
MPIYCPKITLTLTRRMAVLRRRVRVMDLVAVIMQNPHDWW